MAAPARSAASWSAWRRVLGTDGPEALLEFKEEVYRIARVLEEQVGHQAALRYLRDGLAAARRWDSQRVPPVPNAWCASWRG